MRFLGLLDTQIGLPDVRPERSAQATAPTAVDYFTHFATIENRNSDELLTSADKELLADFSARLSGRDLCQRRR